MKNKCLIPYSKEILFIGLKFISLIFLLTGCATPYCPENINVDKVVNLKPDAEKGTDVSVIPYLALNYGDCPFLTGYYEMDDTQMYIFHSYVNFDLSGIPQGATIKKAILKLYIDTTGSDFKTIPLQDIISPEKWTVQPVIQSWSETEVTTTNEPGRTWNGLMKLPSNDLDYTCSIDVTPLVKNQIAFPDRYFGFGICPIGDSFEANAPGTFSNIKYCSSDFEDKNCHPELIITYGR